MGLTNFPNGVSSFGVPVLPGISAPMSMGVGNTWFVSAAGGVNGLGAGTDPSMTLASIAAAVSVATAGDTIVCLEGHTETISTATALSLSKASLKVIGLGVGNRRPTLTFGTVIGATVNVTASGVYIQNMRFVANFADITALFTLTTAKNLTLVGCEILDTSAILNFVAVVKTNTTDNAADYLTMIGCRQVSAGLTANTAVLDLRANVEGLLVQGNTINSLVAGNSGLIYQATTTKVLSNALIDQNVLNFVGANAATGAILITTATTHSGLISRNFVTGARAVATAVLVTASSGFKFMENYYQTVADKSGILLPANA